MAPIGGRATWEEPEAVESAAAELREVSHPVGGPTDLDDLVERLSDARYVLLGEASHGTSEYYRWRAHLTARLVADADFDFVAVEGDWPSCHAVNRYVKGMADAPATVRGALDAFERWPTWMWANWEMVEFFEWLEVHNQEFEEGDRVGFHGLDVYSLYESMAAVVDYLEDVDPEAAAMARERYRCFEPYGEDAQEYARSTRLVPESCEDEVVETLLDLRENAPRYEGVHPDERFAAEQNALVARDAERYYRAMVGGGEDSWNVRDRHMAETASRLADHYGDGTGVIWAHNTHVGDARATDMPRRDRLNLGQLLREQTPAGDVAVVGFGTHRGRVVAADEWGAETVEMRVPEAREGSYGDLFHEAGETDRLLFTERIEEGSALDTPRGHRAIGVVYRPSMESGNYVPTDLRERYDAFLHLDETSALHPLERHAERAGVPNLYPSGL
ncbi:MAG: erythromycin esterase family protein [Haloferacaceae archaeon]